MRALGYLAHCVAFSVLAGVTFAVAEAVIEQFWPSVLVARYFPLWYHALIIAVLSTPFALAFVAIQQCVWTRKRLTSGKFQAGTPYVAALALALPVMLPMMMLSMRENGAVVAGFQQIDSPPEWLTAETSTGGRGLILQDLGTIVLTFVIPSYLVTWLIVRSRLRC